MTAPKIHSVVPFYVMGLAAFVVSILILGWKEWGPQLLINETPSEPVGLYRLVVHVEADYARGMYVVFPVPQELHALVYGRHWLKDGIPFLKELAALAGDHVCVLADRLEINGRYVGPVFDRDSQGLPLPKFRGCFEVPPGAFFAASRYLDKSFDARYFGPLPLAKLLGEARPLWTF